ncbi:MAG TPA: alpha/beta hydrolase [Acidimicrobiia bacterium]|nr:alpha/beta hydrolase [Acidimicrobiia bacterium]
MSEGVTFGLVHGAQHGAWCWERLVPELERLGHGAVAVDLPCDDPDATIDTYASCVVDALAEHDDVVLVGHSLGSLTIPVVARRRPVRRLVFLCSVPTGPGPAIDTELASMVTPEFANASRTFDEHGCESLADADAVTVWYDDCPAEDARRAVERLRPQSRRPLTEPTPLDEWPDVPVSVVLGRDDRCVNMEWAVAAATARTGESPILLPGGHSPFLGRPGELAEVLVGLAVT